MTRYSKDDIVAFEFSPKKARISGIDVVKRNITLACILWPKAIIGSHEYEWLQSFFAEVGVYQDYLAPITSTNGPMHVVSMQYDKSKRKMFHQRLGPSIEMQAREELEKLMPTMFDGGLTRIVLQMTLMFQYSLDLPVFDLSDLQKSSIPEIEDIPGTLFLATDALMSLPSFGPLEPDEILELRHRYSRNELGAFWHGMKMFNFELTGALSGINDPDLIASRTTQFIKLYLVDPAMI